MEWHTPVGDVVSVYAGEDHVINSPVSHCLRSVFWLHRVQGPWCPGGLNSTEAAAPAEEEVSAEVAYCRKYMWCEMHS